MQLAGKAKRVRIYVKEGARIGHQSAVTAVLSFLRDENSAGATAVRGIEGFGSSGVVHTSRIVDIAQQLPVLIEWIDVGERVERLLPRLAEMVGHGLITVDDTEVVLYTPSPVRDVSNTLTATEVMSRDVASVGRDTPVRQVVELMLGKPYRALPVVEAGAPAGIITNTDLITRGGLGARLELLHRLDSHTLKAELDRLTRGAKTAGDVMTPHPVTVLTTTPLTRIAELMAHGRHKRLPVIDGHGALAGIVSRLDLLRSAVGAFARVEEEPKPHGFAVELPLSRVMRRDVPTVHPDTPLAAVVQAVISTRLNRAVVVDAAQRVVGLVTDAELLDRVTPALRPSALRSLMHRLPLAHASTEERETERHTTANTAAGLMSTDVVVCRQDAPLGEAISAMLPGRHKLVAVVDAEEKLVGVLDRADIMRGLIELG